MKPVADPVLEDAKRSDDLADTISVGLTQPFDRLVKLLAIEARLTCVRVRTAHRFCIRLGE
jgi:hypothetical protein